MSKDRDQDEREVERAGAHKAGRAYGAGLQSLLDLATGKNAGE